MKNHCELLFLFSKPKCLSSAGTTKSLVILPFVCMPWNKGTVIWSILILRLSKKDLMQHHSHRHDDLVRICVLLMSPYCSHYRIFWMFDKPLLKSNVLILFSLFLPFFFHVSCSSLWSTFLFFSESNQMIIHHLGEENRKKEKNKRSEGGEEHLYYSLSSFSSCNKMLMIRFVPIGESRNRLWEIHSNQHRPVKKKREKWFSND